MIKIEEIKYIDDVALCASLIHKCLSPKMEPKSAQYINKNINSSNIYHFVAIDDDSNKVIGTASIFTYMRLNGYKFGQIEDVVVDKDYRKQGVGQLLVNHCLDLAKKMDCYKVVLSCSDDNIPFYEKLGFYKHENYMRYETKI